MYLQEKWDMKQCGLNYIVQEIHNIFPYNIKFLSLDAHSTNQCPSAQSKNYSETDIISVPLITMEKMIFTHLQKLQTIIVWKLFESYDDPEAELNTTAAKVIHKSETISKVKAFY